MDMIRVVLDHYRTSILLASKKSANSFPDPESEAISTSRIGYVYKTVLGMHEKAEEYFLQCVLLADSMKPRTFFGCDWFKKAKDSIEDYRRKRADQDSEEWEKKRSGLLKKMKPTLDRMHNALKVSESQLYQSYILVKYLLREHPPKKFKKKDIDEILDSLPPKMHDVTKKQAASAIKKITMFYHPDRNSKIHHSEEWFVFCTEVTKLLTEKISFFKGF
uniref:J domain-containing protein n=2 Tax=Aplanochytrium stocchinoi TaxID=215587 RepID=A0A7S3LLG5_9STRA|mmetsp:Transcript_22870/g.28000  ORF Transcript_22870/g.28000 Transcript_22870/m.28000 type:complete len:219 (-) Transcript_22870:255-911(-)